MIDSTRFSAYNAYQPSVPLSERTGVPEGTSSPAGEQDVSDTHSGTAPQILTAADISKIQTANDNAALEEPVKASRKKKAAPEKEPEAEETGSSADAMNDEGPVPVGKKTRNIVCIPILHTNDIHGLDDRFPALTSLITDLKKEEPQAILVDAGDISFSGQENDEPYKGAIDYLNKNGYYALVPGNHDFQWGRDTAVNEFFKKLQPQVLCANVLDKDTGKELAGAKPYVIRDVEGVKVAFIGVTTTKMQTNEHPDIGNDLIAFGEVQTLQRDVALAKGEGAQVFIAVMHKGLSGIKEISGIAKQVPELDLIISAHDHEVEKTSVRSGPFPHKTYIVEAGCHGNYVGGVTLLYDKDKQAVVKGKMKSYPTKKYIVAAK